MAYKVLHFQKAAQQLLVAIAGLMLTTLPIQTSAESGKQLFESKCGICHVRPDPENLTSAMWVERMETMAPLAGMNAEEKAKVLEYLQLHSGSLEQILAGERVHFDRHCSACHATAETVPKVEKTGNQFEELMIEHVEAKTGKDLEEEAAHEVAEYLLHKKP
jgi:cytochrome c5